MGSFALRWGPLAIGIGAVATALYSVNRALEKQQEARQALGGGRGRFLGAGAEDIAAAAQRTAGGGISSGAAREGILAGVRAGGPDLEIIEQSQRLAQRYAATIQSELLPAQKELAELVGDRTTRSYEEVSKKLDVYSVKTEQNIRSLQNQGKFGEAARLSINAITGALVSQTDATTALQREWAEFLTIMDRGLDSTARAHQGVPAIRQPAGGHERSAAAAFDDRGNGAEYRP